MKRVKVVILAALGVAILAGCGKGSKTTVIDLKVSPQVTETPKPTKAPENPNAIKTNGDYTATNEYLMNHKGEAAVTPSVDNKNTNKDNKNNYGNKSNNINNSENNQNTTNDSQNNNDSQDYDNGDQVYDSGDDGSDNNVDNGNYDEGSDEGDN